MKKNFFALVATATMLVSSMFLTSCSDDSTALGLEEEIHSKPQPAPEGSEIVFENLKYDNEFATRTNELYTLQQQVQLDVVTYYGHSVVSRDNVNRSLDLNALFSAKDIYVATEAELETVSLKEASHSQTTTEVVENGARIGKRVDKERSKTDFSFMFDQNDIVPVNTKFETLVYGDTILPHASIQSVQYKTFTSTRNETLSNQDSLVNDVTLFFEVRVLSDNRVIKSRAAETLVETYEVSVPYRRIYKVVNPNVDEYVKTIVVDYSDVINGNKRDLSVTTAEVWTISGQKNELTEKLSVAFGVQAPAAKNIYSDNASYQTTGNGLSNASEQNSVNGNWNVTTRTQEYTSTASNGLNPFNNVYTVNDAKVVYTRKDATVEFAYGDWTIVEGNSSVGNATANGNYDVYPYANNISYMYATSTDSSRGNAQANASIFVKKADKLVNTVVVSSSDVISGDNRVITVTTQEEWSVSGKKNPVTETIKLPIVWNNPAMQNIYTTNVNYSTRSNGMKAGNETSRKEGNFNVVTRTMGYNSTATNNDKAFNNVYSMSDSKVTYKKNNVTLDFGYGTWNISEGQSTVGATTAEGNYNVSVYTNNVNYTYSIQNGKKSGNGKAQAKLYVEKPVEKVLPAAWGKILGAGISAVPSDDLGEGTNIAKKCLTIRTEKGAVAVTFDWNGNICSVNNILNGYFVEGNFDASYNSGYFTTNTNKGNYAAGKWAPAKASDLKDRIAYYNGTKCVRNVPFTTLLAWNWANGQSTQVSGYTFNVSDNGTLTVKYNGNVVMAIR